MAIKYSTDNIHEKFCIAGPLNLNRKTKQATMMSTTFDLSTKEFDLLLMLAENESQPLTFEALCDTVLDKEYSCKVTVQTELNSLSKKVQEIGMGFIWIDYMPDIGYTFNSLWGRKLQTDRQNVNSPTSITDIKKKQYAGSLRKYNTKGHKIAYASVATAAGLALMLTLFGNDDYGQDFYHLDDRAVPLAASLNLVNNTVFPNINDITISTDTSQTIIAVPNPQSNNHYLAFEIKLHTTDEAIYTSKPFAPGTTIEATIKTEYIYQGEYTVVLNIQAYEPSGFIQQDAISMEFTIIKNQQPQQ